MDPDGHDAHPADSDLHALLDGELEPEARIRLEAHLTACPACAHRLTRVQALFAHIESLPDIPLDRDLSQPVLRALRGDARPMPVLGLLGLQSLAAIALIWAASDRLTRLVAPLAQLELPGPLVASWTALIGALLAMRLPATGFRIDPVPWLPRLGVGLPDLSFATNWILWGFLALGTWLLVNSLVLRAERERPSNGR